MSNSRPTGQNLGVFTVLKGIHPAVVVLDQSMHTWQTISWGTWRCFGDVKPCKNACEAVEGAEGWVLLDDFREGECFFKDAIRSSGSGDLLNYHTIWILKHIQRAHFSKYEQLCWSYYITLTKAIKRYCIALEEKSKRSYCHSLLQRVSILVCSHFTSQHS